MSHRYQSQESELTLREGLQEYFAANPNLVDPEAASTGSIANFFNNHDVSHVVFGTSTELRGEMLQDTWTFFGMDISARRYVGDFLKEEEGKQVMKTIPVWQSVKQVPWYLAKLPQLFWRSRQMSKKWLWEGWEPYLDVPLVAIRREFNIRVIAEQARVVQQDGTKQNFPRPRPD